eukprot:14715974-Alexandrium_andersonii.AAC.1
MPQPPTTPPPAALLAQHGSSAPAEGADSQAPAKAAGGAPAPAPAGRWVSRQEWSQSSQPRPPTPGKG